MLIKEISSMIMDCYYFKRGIFIFEETHSLKPFKFSENSNNLQTIIKKIDNALKSLKRNKKEIKSNLYKKYRPIKSKNILHAENKFKEVNATVIFLFCSMMDYYKKF